VQLLLAIVTIQRATLVRPLAKPHIYIAQRNVNSVFDLAKNLASAKDLAAVVELQTAYWQKQFSALTTQAEEVRALSTKVTADAGEPLKAHVKHGVHEPGKVN
jgi:phasin family protein